MTLRRGQSGMIRMYTPVYLSRYLTTYCRERKYSYIGSPIFERLNFAQGQTLHSLIANVNRKTVKEFVGKTCFILEQCTILV